MNVHNQPKTVPAHAICTWLGWSTIVGIVIIAIAAAWAWTAHDDILHAMNPYRSGAWLAQIHLFLCFGVFVTLASTALSIAFTDGVRNTVKHLAKLAGVGLLLMGVGVAMSFYSVQLYFPDNDERYVFYAFMGFSGQSAVIVAITGAFTFAIGVFGISIIAIRRTFKPRTPSNSRHKK